MLTGDRRVKFYVQRKNLVVVRGWFAWEVQIGRFVVQWVHPEHRDGPCAQGRRLMTCRLPH